VRVPAAGLIGAAAGAPAAKRGTAAGVINAGGSFGQFVFAPLLQKLISLQGWAGAMLSLAALTLAGIPMTRLLRRTSAASAIATRGTSRDRGLRHAVSTAEGSVICCCMRVFFTCGFHRISRDAPAGGGPALPPAVAAGRSR
jgi:hypothetical protein